MNLHFNEAKAERMRSTARRALLIISCIEQDMSDNEIIRELEEKYRVSTALLAYYRKTLTKKYDDPKATQ